MAGEQTGRWSAAKVSGLVWTGQSSDPKLYTVNHASGRQLADALNQLERSRDHYKNACTQTSYEVEQVLGKALGYPWYKDDQQNFPGATEADGVCVGEHVPETLADEAARRLNALEAEVAGLRALLSAQRYRQHIRDGHIGWVHTCRVELCGEYEALAASRSTEGEG